MTNDEGNEKAMKLISYDDSLTICVHPNKYFLQC